MLEQDNKKLLKLNKHMFNPDNYQPLNLSHSEPKSYWIKFFLI